MDKTSFLLEFQDVVEAIPPQSKDKFLSLYLKQQKNPLTASVLGIWLGCLGAHRFYAGDTRLGCLRLLAFIVFVILYTLCSVFYDTSALELIVLSTLCANIYWSIADFFLIGPRVLKKNLEKAEQIKSSMMPTSIWHNG